MEYLREFHSRHATIQNPAEVVKCQS
uniref:Uncharacterized protein n=1 Tax=Arundo donax TaxID=35708 RepID=A0A0A9HS92_ARUDO